MFVKLVLIIALTQPISSNFYLNFLDAIAVGAVSESVSQSVSQWGDNFRFAIYKRSLAMSALSDLSTMSALSVLSAMSAMYAQWAQLAQLAQWTQSGQ